MVKLLSIPLKTATALSIMAIAVLTFFTITAWLTSQWLVIITSQVVLGAMGIFSILAMGAGAFLGRLYYLKRQSELSRDRTLADNEAAMSDIHIERENDRMIAEARMMSVIINQMKNGQIHASQLGEGTKFSSFPSSVIKQIESELPPALPSGQNLDFETVARKALSSRGAGRFIAFGAMDAGKTTICKHAVDYAIQEITEKRGGKVIILDPHAPETVWASDRITVIGAGLDYGSIRIFLDQMKADIKARYEAGCGDDSRPLPAPPVFIICEEWTGIIAELQAKKQWTADDNRAMYMDARKAGYGYFLVSHEHTVGALGLQGMGNLLNGVEYFVTLEKDAITGQHSATLGRSFKDKNPYELTTPGAYNGRMYYSDTQVESERAKTEKYLVLGPVANDAPTIDDLSFVVAPEPEPDEKQKAILALFDEGETIVSRIAKKALGDKGGPQSKKVKETILTYRGVEL